jgi:hypothetical protein
MGSDIREAVNDVLPQKVADFVDSDIGKIAVALPAAQVGGATGAALATGNDLKNAAALDVAGLGAGVGLSGLGLGAGAGGAGAEFTGGLVPGANAGASLGAGGGSAIPAAGLNAGAAAPEILGIGGGSAIPSAGLSVSPAAMSALGAGGLPFAASSGIAAGGEGISFAGAPTSGAPATGAAAGGGGINFGPGAAEAMGVPASTAGAGAGTTGAGTGAATTAAAASRPTFVENIMRQMQDNALALGLIGGSMYMASQQKPELPSQQQLESLSGEARQTADQLLSQYRAGQLSAGQQAGLDQLTRQTKNQITQHFSSIGQADSTAHQQALAQVDQQAFAMRQQMLDGMLQQGLSAIGVATGPLNTMAQYQMGQDQALRQAFGNFANSVGQVFGRSSGAPTGTVAVPPSNRPTSPAPVVQSSKDFAPPA